MPHKPSKGKPKAQALKREAEAFSASHGQVALLDVCLGVVNCILVRSGIVSVDELAGMLSQAIRRASDAGKQGGTRVGR